jgi:hypothetical protein
MSSGIKLEHTRLTKGKPFDVLIHWTGDLRFPVSVLCKIIPHKDPLEARKPDFDIARTTISESKNPIMLGDLESRAIVPQKEESDVYVWAAVVDADKKIVSQWKGAILYQSELSYQDEEHKCPLYPQSYVDYYTCTGHYAQVVFYMIDGGGKVSSPGTNVRISVYEEYTDGNGKHLTIEQQVNRDGFIVITPTFYGWNKSFRYRIMDSEIATFVPAHSTDLHISSPPPDSWQQDSPVKASPIRVVDKYVDYYTSNGNFAELVWKVETDDGRPAQKGTRLLMRQIEGYTSGESKEVFIEKEIDPDNTVRVIPSWYGWNKSFKISIEKTLYSHNTFAGDKAELMVATPPPQGWQLNSPFKWSDIVVQGSETGVNENNSQYAMWRFAAVDGGPIQPGTSISLNVREVYTSEDFKDSTLAVPLRSDNTIMVVPSWYGWNKSFTYSIKETLSSHNVFKGNSAPLTLGKQG